LHVSSVHQSQKTLVGKISGPCLSE
jgi:hypothetical protein